MPKSQVGMSSRLAWPRSSTNIAAAVLTLIGLLGPIGYLTQTPRIANLARVTTASPLPLVFVGAAARCLVDVTLGSGRAVERPCERGLLGQIRGPFWRRYTYFRALVQAPSSDRRERAKQVAILAYGMCSQRGLAHDFGLDESIRRLTVFHWSAGTRSAARSPSLVLCGE